MVMDKSWLGFINQQFNFKLSTRVIRGVRIKNARMFTIFREWKQSTNASLHNVPLLDHLDVYRKTEQGH